MNQVVLVSSQSTSDYQETASEDESEDLAIFSDMPAPTDPSVAEDEVGVDGSTHFQKGFNGVENLPSTPRPPKGASKPKPAAETRRASRRRYYTSLFRGGKSKAELTYDDNCKKYSELLRDQGQRGFLKYFTSNTTLRLPRGKKLRLFNKPRYSRASPRAGRHSLQTLWV